MLLGFSTKLQSGPVRLAVGACDAPNLTEAAVAASAAEMRALGFTPRYGKWAGQHCHGIRIGIVSPKDFRPVCVGLHIVAASCHHPHFTFHTSHFDALAGTSTWRQALVDGATADDIVQQWEADERWFVEHRAAVLLYN